MKWDEAKHPRDEKGEFASKPGSNSPAASIADEPFSLSTFKPKTAAPAVENFNATQLALFHGLNDLAGQKKLFPGMDLTSKDEPAPPVARDPESVKQVKDESQARMSGAKRSKDAIEFPKPIQGPSGTTLDSYEWRYEVIEDVDNRGEERKRRVSNWEESHRNEHTKRDIVHVFHVTDKNGVGHGVSLETALKILGFDDGSKATAKVHGLAEASMKLAQVKQAKQQLLDNPTGNGDKWRLEGYDRDITHLENRVKVLSTEAAKYAAGRNPVDEYRDLAQKAHAVVDAFHWRAAKQNGQTTFQHSRRASPYLLGLTDLNRDQTHERNRSDAEYGSKLLGKVRRAMVMNVLSESSAKTPPQKDSKMWPAWSDQKVRNWYQNHGEGLEQAIQDAHEWLKQHHPHYEHIRQQSPDLQELG